MPQDADSRRPASAATPHPSTDLVGADSADPFADVLAGGSVLDELDDAARVEAWASSALGVWAEAPDAADHDDVFLAWLGEVAAADDPRSRQARLVRAAIMALQPGPPSADRDATGHADGPEDIEAPPAWIGHLGTAATTRAWRVERHGVESVGIGFASSDGSEHSLLADLVDGELAALIVAPGPAELFDGSEDLVAPEGLDVTEAAERIDLAWRLLHRRGTETPESVHVNGALARARLVALTGRGVDDLRVPVVGAGGDDIAPEPDVGDSPGEATDDDRAETDRWACSVLDGAIGAVSAATPVGHDDAVDLCLEALLPARVAIQPALEREAYEALEWADWLGIVIEAVRQGAGTPVDPEAMIDAVNRCPEVTSSIPRSDRAYYAWAFSLLLALWRRAGVVDGEGRLTALGVIALPAALRRAWGSISPE